MAISYCFIWQLSRDCYSIVLISLFRFSVIARESCMTGSIRIFEKSNFTPKLSVLVFLKVKLPNMTDWHTGTKPTCIWSICTILRMMGSRMIEHSFYQLHDFYLLGSTSNPAIDSRNSKSLSRPLFFLYNSKVKKQIFQPNCSLILFQLTVGVVFLVPFLLLLAVKLSCF